MYFTICTQTVVFFDTTDVFMTVSVIFLRQQAVGLDHIMSFPPRNSAITFKMYWMLIEICGLKFYYTV